MNEECPICKNGEKLFFFKRGYNWIIYHCVICGYRTKKIVEGGENGRCI